MKKFTALLSTIFALAVFVHSSAQNANIAYRDANVRFTVITDGTIRMEYAPDGQFVDAPSFVAVNRSYPKSNYTVKDGSTVEITTPCMTLPYKKGSGPFTDNNLSITAPKIGRASCRERV